MNKYREKRYPIGHEKLTLDMSHLGNEEHLRDENIEELEEEIEEERPNYNLSKEYMKRFKKIILGISIIGFIILIVVFGNNFKREEGVAINDKIQIQISKLNEIAKEFEKQKQLRQEIREKQLELSKSIEKVSKLDNEISQKRKEIYMIIK